MDRILNLTETNDVLNEGLLIVTCVMNPAYFFSQYQQAIFIGCDTLFALLATFKTQQTKTIKASLNE